MIIKLHFILVDGYASLGGPATCQPNILRRERAQVSGGEGSQLLCIFDQRASWGGCVEAPTAATPGVA